MDKCTVCHETPNPSFTPEELRMQACRACAKKLGLIPIPPARRPPKPCARCDGRRFLHAIPREHSTVRAWQDNEQLSAPMFVTYQPMATGVVMRRAGELEIESGHGLLEMYICYGCGAVEWYCSGVAQIPVHPLLMTEVVEYPGEGPYR